MTRMATQSRQQTQHAPAHQQMSAKDLLEEILNRPLGERHRALDAAITNRIPKIEELLPEFMKGQGERLAKRAMVTFARVPDLQSCPPPDFVRCVLEAAEMGFAIDGKMCYVVNYKGKYQCQLDYKGIVAVARRMKTIKDIYGDVVGANDLFHARRKNGDSYLEHSYQLGQDRGDIVGAYCVIKLPANDDWRYEVMDVSELNRIQDRAPAKNGPWKTDINEMRKKTVFRRALKLYVDDPGLIRVMELTDLDDDDEPAKPHTLSALDERITRPEPRSHLPPSNGNGNGRQMAAGEIPLDTPDEPAAETDAGERPQTGDSPNPDIANGVDMDLQTAEGIGDCEEVKARWLKSCQTDADRTCVLGACEARADAIRASRGAGSNKK